MTFDFEKEDFVIYKANFSSINSSIIFFSKTQIVFIKTYKITNFILV